MDTILGCNGMVWVAPHAPPPALGADGEPEQAPPPPPATPEQRGAVCRVACALRALAALYFPIFPATLVEAYQVRMHSVWQRVCLPADQHAMCDRCVPGGLRAVPAGRADFAHMLLVSTLQSCMESMTHPEYMPLASLCAGTAKWGSDPGMALGLMNQGIRNMLSTFSVSIFAMSCNQALVQAVRHVGYMRMQLPIMRHHA